MSDPTAPVTRREFLCNRWLGDHYCPEPMHPIDGRHEDHAAAPPAAPSEDATHEHRASYPSPCEGCEHLAAAMVRRMPVGLRWTDDEFRAAAIRPAHFAADPNTPAADCHNLTHRALDDARDELRAIRAAAGDGGLRTALKEAVRLLGGGRQGYVGDHYIREIQVKQDTVDRLRAALAHTESATDGSGDRE